MKRDNNRSSNKGYDNLISRDEQLGNKSFIEHIIPNWFVIRELTAREIKRKYVRSYLGMIWSVLSPLMFMVVMSLIFSYMFRQSIELFPLYYLTGITIWTLFKDGSSQSLSSLVDNKTLLLKAKLSKNTFVLSRIYTALVNFGLSCIAYILMLLVFGIKPSLTMLVFIPDIILLLFFTIGIGYILSILYVFFADIKYLYDVLMTLWLFSSAIFYPADRLPDFLQKIIGYNPVYIAIYIAREGVVYGHWPHWSAWVKLIIAAGVIFALGVYIFNKNQNKVMQKI